MPSGNKPLHESTMIQIEQNSQPISWSCGRTIAYQLWRNSTNCVMLCLIIMGYISVTRWMHDLSTFILIFFLHITVASWWVRRRLKSPACRLFAQPFVQAQIKKPPKPCVTGLCEGNPSLNGGFPSRRASNVYIHNIYFICPIICNIFLHGMTASLYSIQKFEHG